MNTQFTDKTDMIGLLALNIANAQLADFNSIVKYVEEFYTRNVLGDEIWNAFETDVDTANPTAGVPSLQKFIDLLDGVTYTDTENYTEDKVINVEGLKEAWKYFSYYEYLNQAPYVSNFQGKATTEYENGNALDRQQNNVETQTRYNKGVDLWNNIRCFLEYYEDYKVDYTGIVEVAGTYTVSLSDTTYLSVGDKVTIDSSDFTVTAVTTDTNFTFTAATGLTFVNDYVTWFPFENVPATEKGKIFFNGLA